MDAATSSAANPALKKDSPGGLHILVLDPLFRVAHQPGSTRSHDLGRHLVQAGHRVSVLTTTAAQAAAGMNTIDGINVTALTVGDRVRFGFALPPKAGGAFVRGSSWRMWRFAAVDAVVAVDRPIAALPMTVLFCAVRGIPLVLEARSGLPVAPGPGAAAGERIAAWIARGALRLAAKYARHVIALTREIRDALAASGVADSKIIVSVPGCDTALFALPPGAENAVLAAHPHFAHGHLAVYAGGMGAGHKLDGLLDLAAALQATNPSVNIALCGDGPARGALEARALELGVLNKNLWLLEPQPRKDLPALLAASSAVLIAGDSPGLFFDALAASRPVALMADDWHRELIEGRGAGIGLPGDSQAAARELSDFLKDGDGLRRANQQAAALAAGRFNLDRIAAEVRGAIEGSVAADPRAAVIRRRTMRAKRALDIVMSLAALIVLSPVMLGLAVAVRAQMGNPILFAQSRPGLKGKLFRAYKFRTMTEATDAGGALLPDGARLTPFGRALRRSSLDQLPELFNVLKGEMSLVGPRPLLPEYLPYYTAEQRRRHDVAPGMTGWSQVNGRNALTWEDKFALDLWYVDNVGLWLDFKIMLKTVWIVVTGDGVNAPGHSTMPRFDEIMARRQGAEDV